MSESFYNFLKKDFYMVNNLAEPSMKKWMRQYEAVQVKIKAALHIPLTFFLKRGHYSSDFFQKMGSLFLWLFF